MHRIDKPWGYEEWLEVNEKYVVKRLMMKKGNQCSLQYHEAKKETVMVLSGTLTVYFNDQIIKMAPSDTLTIEPHDIHRMFAENEDCLYLECSTPELDDVVRIEDDYGRK
jgi:mannose-6-phosphate isomerase-like protein (cupin superfamily)